MTHFSSIVPSAMGGSHGWAVASGKQSALPSDASFASLFAGLQAQIGTGATAAAATDPTAQLEALMQNGTPLQTIVDQIAQSVGNSVQTQMAGQLSQQDLDQLKSSIVQQITNALSPNSNAPPGTPHQQMMQLAAKLKSLIAKIEKQPGQQNEITGNILDAKSAKEIPAQVQGKQASGEPVVSSLVSQLLRSVVSTLQGTGQNTTSADPNAVRKVRPIYRGSDPIARRSGYSADPIRSVNQLNEQQRFSMTQPAQAASALIDDATPTLTNGTASTSTQPAITMNDAPDLLARMLVRAAGADAQVTGNSALASAAPVQANAGNTQSPSAILARFEALIANVVQADSASNPSGGNSTSGQFSQSFGQQQGSQTTFTTQDSVSNLIAAPVTAPSDPLQNIAQATTNVQNAQIDANAVLEQLVKGMMMRTNTQGDSEIRLHLQPENLGAVTMKITVSGNQISANIVAANADVRSALQSGHQQLAKSLANSGLTLSGFSVDVSGGDAKRDQSQGGTSGFGRRYTIHEIAQKTTTESQPVSNLGPALLSGAGLELFNYLV